MNRPIVTAHAMVRYLERKHGRMVKRVCREARKLGDGAVLTELSASHGLDQQALTDEILSPTVVDAFRVGATRVKHDGVCFVFAGGKIVTVTPTHFRAARRP